MVEDKEIYKKTKTTVAKLNRPKAVQSWTTADTIRFFGRHLSEYSKYTELFQQHHITGRALLRLNDNSLKRLGITNDADRDAILKEILKQSLKSAMQEIKDLENLNNVYENCFQESK